MARRGKGRGPLKTLEKASLAQWYKYLICIAEALHG